MKMSSPREAHPSLSFCCPEKLDNMTPADGGHYCGKCEKVVKDFSGMTNKAIAETLLHSSSENACGTFRAHQLQQPFNDRRDKLVGFYQHVSGFAGKRNFVRVMTLLFLSGCHRRMSGIYAAPPRHKIKKSMEKEERKVEGRRKARKTF